MSTSLVMDYNTYYDLELRKYFDTDSLSIKLKESFNGLLTKKEIKKVCVDIENYTDNRLKYNNLLNSFEEIVKKYDNILIASVEGAGSKASSAVGALVGAAVGVTIDASR